MTTPSTDQIADSGQLIEFSLPHLLLALERRRYDGTLELSHDRSHKKFSFRAGAPVLAESNLASEALGAQLVSEGRLAQADRDKVSAYMRRKKCREGAALLAMQLLSAKELFQALKEQLRLRLIETFGWPDGHWQILPEEPDGDDVQALRSDPLPLIQAGLATHWSVDRLLADLAGHAPHYASSAPNLDSCARRLRFDARIRALLVNLDGQARFDQLLAAGMNAPNELAGLWVLDAVDAFHYHDEPICRAQPDAIGPDFDAEIEIAVNRRASRADVAAAASGAVSTARTNSSKDVQREKLRTEIEDRLRDLATLDHYALLGVEADASTAAIKKAYFRAAKRYHPDALSRLGLEELRPDAATVFARMAEAFETLSASDRRAEYDASLDSQGGAIDTNRLAQAETFYRKGEILIRMGDFKGSLDFLRPAVDLWPDESAYQSALGWALHKQSPSDPEAAREHLETAVELGPADAVAHLRLGLVLRSLGQEREAEKLTALARKLDPDVAS